MQHTRKLVSALTLTIALAGPGLSISRVEAQGIPVYDNTSWLTALQQVVEMERQYSQMVTQYEHMLEHAKTITDIRNVNDVHRLTESLERLRHMYEQSQALAGQVEGFDEAFRRHFPGYEDHLTQSGPGNSDAIFEGYKHWNEKGADAMRTAMRSAGANVSSIASEDQMLSELVSLSQRSNTQTQAIQAGNEIASMMVQQMQQLRLMLNDQVQSQSYYTSQIIERQAAEDAAREAWFSERIEFDGPAMRF